MAFMKLQFRPGVNRDNTDYANEGGWYASDKIRFRSGMPEKIGGWQKSGGNTFMGVCRQLWNWVTTYSDNMLALGTNLKAYIEAGGYYNDITPLREQQPTLASPVTDNSISTTAGSDVVTVTLTAPHEAITNGFVTITGVTGTIGGIPASEINGNQQLTANPANPNQFTFVAATPANASAGPAGGTAISMSFEINPGNAIATAGYGWGTGTWGRGSWGLGSTTPVFLPQQDWFFDNFDNDLVMNIRNGPMYWWERGTISNPGAALGTRAILMQDYAYNTAIANGSSTTDAAAARDAVPSKVGQILVSQQDRHLIAFGAVPYGYTDPADFDPMVIRWADMDNPTVWTPEVLNSAGDLRVSRGSHIVRGLATRQEILIFTDGGLFTLQFLGTTDVFGLQEYSDNISIMSPRACISAVNITYWMGQDKFFAYTGRVETLPCTLRDHVFNNISKTQADQVVCGTNEGWNEVWWFYPTEGADYNNAYVIYNYHDEIWYYGYIDRTAWLDSPMRPYPQACNTTVDSTDPANPVPGPGYLYDHESDLNDDGAAMQAYIQSSDLDLDSGDHLMLIRRILPDINFEGSVSPLPSVLLEMRPRNFPGGPVWGDPEDVQRVVTSSYNYYSNQVFMRARARQMAFKISSDKLDVQWQLGNCRLDVRPDGTRG